VNFIFLQQTFLTKNSVCGFILLIFSDDICYHQCVLFWLYVTAINLAIKQRLWLECM